MDPHQDIHPDPLKGLATDPTSIVLANVYATALMDMMSGDAAAQQTADELDALVDMIYSIEGCEELLTTPMLRRDTRLELWNKFFGGRLSQDVECLIHVMARHGRSRLIGQVARQFRKLLARRRGFLEIRLTTAAPADERTVRHLTDIVQANTGAKASIITEVNPALIGGMIVRIGDEVYDMSVACQIRRIRGQVLAHKPNVKAVAV
ncbi:MAG: ATP synthase F1 subunit delta [Planctomycetes bacterium]|nr:ATP synthase F1 subunit delta [Planctomycetota bacterium]